jgi:hypothetical protein
MAQKLNHSKETIRQQNNEKNGKSSNTKLLE